MITKLLSTRFHRNQDGTAITEFVLLLPVWITIFVGIVALGQLGMNTTVVPIKAQQDLWSNALKKPGAASRSPLSAGIQGAVATNKIKTKTNGQKLAKTQALANNLGLELGGHWGESYSSMMLLNNLPNVNVNNLTRTSDNIIDDAASGFPKKIVDDSIGSVSFDGGSFLALIGDMLAGSGLVASTGANIRYGVASGEHEATIKALRATSFNTRSNFDVLIAPEPADHDKRVIPYLLARVMAEGDTNYSVMLNFGEEEFEDDSGGSGEGGFSLPDMPDFNGGKKPPNHDKDIEDEWGKSQEPGYIPGG